MATGRISSVWHRPVAMTGSRRRKPAGFYIRRVIQYAVMIILSVIFMIPLAWLVSTSLKEQGQVFAYPPIWIPNPIRWSNYAEALQRAPLLRWLANTATITVFAIVGNVLTSSMVAFGFARLRFPGRGPLFILLLSTMMLPEVVTLIPRFILFKSLGWLDTFLPMIVPPFFGGGAYNIFLVRQFYLTIPTDFDEAARIDGASNWVIWRRILVPLSTPVLTAIAIFSFVYHWNDFLHPLLYLFTEDKKTLALGLRAFINPYDASWQISMAAAMFLVVPIMIIFFLGQRYFIRGVVMTGIQGR
ncbi:MAG: carbohydrate ABC transporter permease [Anaerolineae bacterium]|nr:carbohydrate ABC transporter permease [Anaerolineae bacterium]MDW8098800.1 carbohydrate ABC transporter permease [Anaerolineae bacterium]